jgi:hypothetical protein
MTTGNPTPTLDDAQAALIEALTVFEDNERTTETGHDIGGVEDGGAARHDRVVMFTLSMPDGTSKTFAATITEEEDEWNPDEN